MLITCPSCSSDYVLDPERIGLGGRKVRCAACRESWFVARPEPRAEEAAPVAAAAEGEIVPPESERPIDVSAPIVVIEPATLPPPPARRKTPAKPSPSAAGRRRRTAADGGRAAARLPLGAAAAILLLLALPPALLMRSGIVAAMPGTAILFSALGLPVNLVGLDFAALDSQRAEENGAPVLLVAGEIRNTTSHTRTVPPIEVAIEGEGGEHLYDWTVQPPEGELGARDRMAFRARLAAPPPAGRNVVVRFREKSRSRFASR